MFGMDVASERIENQSGPCGIICKTCPLGSGSVAESAGLANQSIKECRIPEWSPFIPGGKDIDWAMVEKELEWTAKYACCKGCENGGGPPDCTIRICAKERGYKLCSNCSDLESCSKFDWLKDYGSQMKTALKENKGRTKEEYIRTMADKMPWNSR